MVAAADALRTGRLRWHCRRALLELDLVFQRFWNGMGEGIDEATADVLERLLSMEDRELWDLVCGRASTDDPQIKGLVERLREA